MSSLELSNRIPRGRSIPVSDEMPKTSNDKVKVYKKVTNGTAWTAAEISALQAGVKKHGVGNWAEIASAKELKGRTNVNLKDK